jgi:hypothetical protein
MAENQKKRLIPFFEHVELKHLSDYWWLLARVTEDSLLASGAIPGVDYTYIDLYKLSQPLLMEEMKKGELVMETYEN